MALMMVIVCTTITSLKQTPEGQMIEGIEVEIGMTRVKELLLLSLVEVDVVRMLVTRVLGLARLTGTAVAESETDGLLN